MNISPKLRRAVTWPLYALAIMWGVQLLQQVLGVEWFHYGILPRQVDALRGIVTTPFLHGSWAHLLSNTFPFFVLMGLILYFYPRVAPSVLLMLYLLTGVAMWLFADPEVFFSGGTIAYHIGASGVVYSMAAFLTMTGFFRRSFRSVAIALVVVFYYGGMIWGVLPIKEGVSWEGHLAGVVVGILAAYWYKDKTELEDQTYIPEYRRNPDAPKPFLDSDTFERSKR